MNESISEWMKYKIMWYMVLWARGFVRAINSRYHDSGWNIVLTSQYYLNEYHTIIAWTSITDMFIQCLKVNPSRILFRGLLQWHLLIPPQCHGSWVYTSESKDASELAQLSYVLIYASATVRQLSLVRRCLYVASLSHQIRARENWNFKSNR